MQEFKGSGYKNPPLFTYVVHATEETRRAKFQGCVSRQTLRVKLRQEALANIDSRFGGELHSTRRLMAFSKAHRDYRSLMNLPVLLRPLRIH